MNYKTLSTPKILVLIALTVVMVSLHTHPVAVLAMLAWALL